MSAQEKPPCFGDYGHPQWLGFAFPPKRNFIDYTKGWCSPENCAVCAECGMTTLVNKFRKQGRRTGACP